mgnify:CR=1 FL=1
MVSAALQVVRANGIDGLTAKALADELGTSTQPVFTAFGSMDALRQAVHAAALDIYGRYMNAGLLEDIPFFGAGMQYIRFAREEPALYRLLFLSETANTAADTMQRLQTMVCPALRRIYRLTGEEAEVYFRDLWLVVHGLATLIVNGGCPYSDREIGQLLTGVSLSICKAIKEIPGFASGEFDRDAAFRALIGEENTE